MAELNVMILAEGIPFHDFEVRNSDGHGNFDIISIGSQARLRNLDEGRCPLYNAGCKSDLEGMPMCFGEYPICSYLQSRVKEREVRNAYFTRSFTSGYSCNCCIANSSGTWIGSSLSCRVNFAKRNSSGWLG